MSDADEGKAVRTTGRRDGDAHTPQSSPDINSIQLTVMRMFLSVKGKARLILIPAAAIMGIMSQFYTQGIQALLAGATAWTSLRNQELSAQAAQQQVELESLRLELEKANADAQAAAANANATATAAVTDSEEAKKQARLDKRIGQLQDAIKRLNDKPKPDAAP